MFLLFQWHALTREEQAKYYEQVSAALQHVLVHSGFVQGSEGAAIAHANVPRMVGKRQLCPVQGSKYYYGI